MPGCEKCNYRGYSIIDGQVISCEHCQDRVYEDQHINCQDEPCGQAPLGCTDKRYCPKE